VFYPSKVLSRQGYYPETVRKRAMLNPKYKVKHFQFPFDSIMDSGAFQDIDKHIRLNPEAALKRQTDYISYIKTINSSFELEAICIYDQMIGIDEALIDGKKVKKRGTEETGIAAVEDTLLSANYYNKSYTERIVYIAQGVTPKQYMYCTNELLTLMRTDDYFGFGGFCIIGKQKNLMLRTFLETLDVVLPVLKKKQLKRVHLLGVCIPDAITMFNKKCRQYSIKWSTDSSAPEVAARRFGRTYNRITGRQHAKKWIKYKDYDPYDLALENIESYNTWIESLK
jgi:hypothetical protein